MQEIDRTDSAEAIDFAVVLNIPPAGIDLRRILLALRNTIPKRKILFAATSRADVFVPTLREKFTLIPYKDFLLVKTRKKIKIPMMMDGPLLSIEIIDIIVAWIENQGINDKFNTEPLPTLEHTDH